MQTKTRIKKETSGRRTWNTWRSRFKKIWWRTNKNKQGSWSRTLRWLKRSTTWPRGSTKYSQNWPFCRLIKTGMGRKLGKSFNFTSFKVNRYLRCASSCSFWRKKTSSWTRDGLLDHWRFRTNLTKRIMIARSVRLLSLPTSPSLKRVKEANSRASIKRTFRGKHCELVKLITFENKLNYFNSESRNRRTSFCRSTSSLSASVSDTPFHKKTSL